MKIQILFSLLLVTYSVFAQHEHGVKVGANFATIKTNVDYGSEINALLCPNVSYIFSTWDDHWGYYLELGYSQSGLKETTNSVESTLKVYNMDFIPIGIQYAFLSDWSKIRPFLQASIGTRVSFYGKIESPYGTDDSFLDKYFDILWAAGGGVLFGKHVMINCNYGGGFLKAISSQSDWKNRQTQIAIAYFF